MTKKQLKLELESLVRLAAKDKNLKCSPTIEHDLNDLRVFIKYLRFDLEATRRELKEAKRN